MNEPTSLLRIRDVCQRVGLSRTAVYDKMAEGDFPQPVRLSTRNVRWRSDEIAAWIDRVSARPRSVLTHLSPNGPRRAA